MAKSRKQRSAEFKAMVAMEAFQGIKTVSEIARAHDVHPAQIAIWKKELKERSVELFKKKSDIEVKQLMDERGQLQKKVGELTMDVDFLKKKCVQLNIPLD